MYLATVVTTGCLLMFGGLTEIIEAKAKDYRKLGAEYVPAESGKVGLEEPTCEELRAMWRFSKRQSRAAEITNEIPQYRDPFVYNIWEPYPSSSGVTGVGMRTKSGVPVAGRRQRPVYGRIVHTPPPGITSLRTFENAAPLRMGSYEEVARMFNSRPITSTTASPRKTYRFAGLDATTSVPQAGSFQQLKELVRAERARELQQRFAEEQAVVADYGRIRHGPPSREETAYGSLRYGRFEEPRQRGVLAFPDVLAPAARMEQYVYVDQPLGFASAEDAYAPSSESELEAVPAKPKHRSAITKGRREYGSRHAGGGSGGGGISGSLPLAEKALPLCSTIANQKCTSSSACECEGGEVLYRCSVEEGKKKSREEAKDSTLTAVGRCKVLPLDLTESDQFGTWHASPLESSQLGIWHRRKRSVDAGTRLLSRRRPAPVEQQQQQQKRHKQQPELSRVHIDNNSNSSRTVVPNLRRSNRASGPNHVHRRALQASSPPPPPRPAPAPSSLV